MFDYKMVCVQTSVLVLSLAALTGCAQESVVEGGVGAESISTSDTMEVSPQEQYPMAPEFIGLTNWTNSEPIESLSSLHGQVVLVEFWTFACINCIRTLPHVQALYEKYQDEGFVVIGVHAPEFSYERKIENVRAKVLEYGLTYPIAQDNDFTTWRNYKNRYWPAQYLIDREGRIRATHFGEGKYAETDALVAELLAEGSSL